MKKAILIVGLFFSNSLFAAGVVKTVNVDGMVCSFCAQGIEKKFAKLPEVEKVEVNLGKKQVSLTMKEGQDLSDAKITELLQEAGYTVRKSP